MWRKIHLWFGLIASLLVVIIALTGSMLATKPVYNAYQYNNALNSVSVAESLEKIYTANKRIEPQKLILLPSGKTKFIYAKNNKTREKAISLVTGKLTRSKKEPAFYVLMRKLHRSLLLGRPGRIIPAIAGIAMLLLTVSGLVILTRRVGGVRALFASMSWRGLSNQHSALGRLSLIPLVIIAVTSVWLSGVTYKIIVSGSEKPPAYPESLKELDPVNPWDLKALKTIPIQSVNEIIFPIPVDWFDVWTIKTDKEYIFVDQFTGDVLKREPLPFMARAMDWVTVLHTGQGNVWWAIILMFSALSVPFFAVTGVIMWWRGRKLKGGKILRQASAGTLTTLILVGSEGGSTWGFAKALHDGLTQAGESVRTIEMNALAKSYPNLRNLLVLVATYGDGDEPQSAKRFFSRLDKFKNQNIQFATLAFGDQAFPKFCAYGREVNEVLQSKFSQPLIELTEVDKRSNQTFQHWCGQLNEQLSENLNSELIADYQSKRQKTRSLKLIEKSQFGEALNVPMSILRFEGPIPKHQPGDWLAVYAPDCDVARLYSLGSSSKHDGAVEICVRRQEGGVCSPMLFDLEKDDSIDVYVIKNPHFHQPKKKPIIMICAGTGLAPFVGMIRHNKNQQEIDLFWGGRHPDIDGIYGDEIKMWLENNCLTNFFPAWSRFGEKIYVQNVIAHQRELLKDKLVRGATIMICGGRTMAHSVEEEIEKISNEIGLSVEVLKKKGRYLEDVY